LSLEPPLASTAPLSPAELKLKLYVDLISATLRSIYLFIQAQVIKNIGVILEEAGTSWDYVMKTTVFLANMSDYTAMNSVYGAMLPSRLKLLRPFPTHEVQLRRSDKEIMLSANITPRSDYINENLMICT
jgi:hypothetical protein